MCRAQGVNSLRISPEIIMKKISLFVALFLMSGCATIISGTTQKVNVTTTPSDATAKVDNILSAKTPTVFTLERKSDHTLEISKEGFKSTTVLMRRTFNGMATGNILIGGLIGTGVDAVSGATNKIIPERVDLILEEGEGTALPKFANAKDQEFYDKNILKIEQDKTERQNKEETEKQAKLAKDALKASAIRPAGSPATNFSAANR